MKTLGARGQAKRLMTCQLADDTAVSTYCTLTELYKRQCDTKLCKQLHMCKKQKERKTPSAHGG